MIDTIQSLIDIILQYDFPSFLFGMFYMLVLLIYGSLGFYLFRFLYALFALIFGKVKKND